MKVNAFVILSGATVEIEVPEGASEEEIREKILEEAEQVEACGCWDPEIAECTVRALEDEFWRGVWDRLGHKDGEW
ncbi:MAG: hypothetical protein M5U26_11875 [Planctomycetota bacterium]|nr:hypothetical protein [Planctomycetota bacterium]